MMRTGGCPSAKLARRSLVAGLAVIVAVGWLPAQPALAQPRSAVTVVVTGVLDGATVELAFEGGGATPLGLVGILPLGGPEAGPSGACSEAAAVRLDELARGRVALLEYDVDQRDARGRPVGYLWIDGVMLNLRLAAEGYAAPDLGGRNIRHAQAIRNAAADARAQGLGLWPTCG